MRRNVRTTYDPNLPSGKKFVAVHVQNEDPLYFLVEVKSKVCELFAQICKFLNLLEPELFGLAIKCSDCFIFLDPLEKMSKYAPKPWKTQNNGMDNEGHPLFNVFFRVQFYVDSYLFISDKVAKLLYYHQMRENVLNYDQSMCEERAFQLASYALQADYGNYNPQLHKLHYFVPSHYFPAWVIEELGVDYIVRNLPALHCDHKGMSRSEAQSMYIKEASDSSAPHNFHFYQLCCKKMHHNNSNNNHGGGGSNSLSLATSSSINSATSSSSFSSNSNSSMYNVWLAITISGIAIYARDFQTSHSHHYHHFSDPSSQSSTSSQSSSSPSPPSSSRLKTRISFFPWSDIGKLSFEKKKFEIRSTGAQGRKFVYYAPGEEISRHLLWFSRASHQFHLMVQTKMKEMLKREAEITRRKYRESCVSTVSCSNSTGSSSSGNSSAGPSNPSASCSSTTTSKSVSPFDLCSTTTGSNSHPSSPASSANSSTNSNHIGTKKMGKVGPAHSHHSHHYHHLLVPKNKIGINQAGTSDLDISNSSSVCGDDPNSEQQRVSVISNASSNTTSGIVSDKLNSCSLEDSDRDDIDSDLLMSLNHPDHHLHHLNHLHHHASVGRTVTLSGCSTKPQPVVSLESLALSEPIDHRNGRSSGISTPLDDHKLVKSVNLATNKKHSISISNIVITANQSNNSGHSITQPMSSSTSPTKQNLIENSSSKMLFETNVDDVDTEDDDVEVDDNEQQYLHESVIPVVPPTPNNENEVMITGESCSKVLCLNINPKPAIRKSAIAKRNIQESNLDLCCTSSVNDLDDDCSDFDDDVDSMIFDSSANKSYLSGKSNVTVLSTILKPEAERLLKQGIKADDAELLMIDSKEMAEFKEFEQAEKEKIILNSLINNMPPPPLIRSCNSEDEEDDEDTSSSSSSSSDDDDEDHIMIDCVKVKVPRRKCSSNKTGCDVQGSQATTTIGVTPTSPTKRSCYSPLMQEKSYYHRYTRNGSSSGSSTSSSSSSSSPPQASSNQTKSNPIYENLISPNSAKPNPNNNCKALLNIQKSCPLYNNFQNEVRNRESRLPPPAPLRPTPSLNAIGGFSTPTHSHSHQHRTGMRIGVSSLNRPLNSGVNNNNRANLNALLAAGGCYHNQQQMQKSHNLLNETNQNLCCRTNLLDSATAGSEPNLSMMSSSMNYWNMPKLFPAPAPQPPPLPKKRDSLLNQKSSSVIDNLDRTGSTFLEQPQQQQQQFCSTFRQFIANHQPIGTEKHVNLYDDDDNDNNEKVSKVLSQDNNNNIENIHCYPGIQHKQQQQQLYSDIPHRTTQTQTSCVASQKNNNGGDNLKGNGSITNLHQLRQRSSDLNLPLITALFNDSTLMSMSSKFSQPQQSQPEPQSQNNPAKSQSLQQIPDQVGYNLPVRGNAQNNNHQNVGGGGTVERTNTFRVDEAIANGAINRGNPHHSSSTPISSNMFQPNQNCRPTSWHLSAENCSSSSNHPQHHFVEQTIWARRENQI